MREIKFRAWDKLGDDEGNPCMRSWELLLRDRYVQSADSIFNDKTLILMQYTGLKDKNGVEIYEGDIILVNGIGQCTIVYGCHCIGKDDYGIEHCTFGFSGEWEDGSGHYGIQDSEGITIIGNIYENADLLK